MLGKRYCIIEDINRNYAICNVIPFLDAKLESTNSTTYIYAILGKFIAIIIISKELMKKKNLFL